MRPGVGGGGGEVTTFSTSVHRPWDLDHGHKASLAPVVSESSHETAIFGSPLNHVSDTRVFYERRVCTASYVGRSSIDDRFYYLSRRSVIFTRYGVFYGRSLRQTYREYTLIVERKLSFVET